jgi:hypothetical protein
MALKAMPSCTTSGPPSTAGQMRTAGASAFAAPLMI